MNNPVQLAAAELIEPSEQLRSLRTELQSFLKNNPLSSVEEIVAPDGKKSLRIVKPWGDSSVGITVPPSSETHEEDTRADLISALNGIVLPPRFTAIWHLQTSKLEVIWTAFKLQPSQVEVANRSFTFHYAGLELKCEFAKSTDALLSIARFAAPGGMGGTSNFRNLQSYTLYLNAGVLGDVTDMFDEPRSFFISGLPQEYDDELLAGCARHLNFFMSYYDARCPTIVIHSPDEELSGSTDPVRYIKGNFPTAISTPELDQNLLSFWASARTGNEILRFVLYWRVIEYAAFHFVASKTKTALKRVLADPALLANLEASIEKIVGTVVSGDMDDVPRFNNLMQVAVAPEVLWAEISLNKAHFSVNFTADGGFVIPPLISSNETLDTFGTGGPGKVAAALRKIRNCLSHGKDQGSEGVILPTTRNLRALRPWVHLIAKAAGEVILYREVS